MATLAWPGPARPGLTSRPAWPISWNAVPAGQPVWHGTHGHMDEKLKMALKQRNRRPTHSSGRFSFSFSQAHGAKRKNNPVHGVSFPVCVRVTFSLLFFVGWFLFARKCVGNAKRPASYAISSHWSFSIFRAGLKLTREGAKCTFI